MKKYEEISIEIVVLQKSDIITVSGWDTPGVELPTVTSELEWGS